MITLMAMLCTIPLTMKDPARDAEIILNNCSAVPKAFTSDHKQCNDVMLAFKKTTGMLSMPGYYVCQSEEAKDPLMTITPVPYHQKGTRT